jgi:hypothetical protein
VSAPAGARRVIVAAFDAQPGSRLDRVVDLVAALSDLGWEPDVVLVGDGLQLDDLRRRVPVTVVDEFRRRGLGFVPHLLRWSKAERAVKRFRVQRWLRAHEGMPWIVADPRAAAILRYAPSGAPRTVVGYMASSTDRVDALAPADRALLDHASGWLVATDEQAGEVAAADLGAATVVAALAPPDPTAMTEAVWPVLLVPTPGAWSEVNHTIEVAQRLVERHPSIPIHWLVRSREDEWLAAFDLDHLGLADVVQVVWPDEAPVGRYRMIVRTGYGDAEQDWCRAAAQGAVPVVGFDVAGPDGTTPLVRPFDLDGLLDEIDRALPDEDSIRVRQERYRDAVDAHADAVARLGTVLDGLTALA